MSFNNALKKVLGLGDFGEGVDDLEYFEKRNYDNPWRKDDDEKKAKSNGDDNGENRDDKAQGQPQVKRLMNIINGNLSPHILNNLNVEAETRAIVESLRPQFRDYETNLRKDVLDSAAERWNKERSEIIEKLKGFLNN